MSTPDIGVQKITVQKQNLPSLDSDNKYFVRYRIKTKDGIATTAWSPVYRPTKQSIVPIFGAGGTHNADEREIKSHGRSFDVSWKIKNTITDLVEIPEQIKDLPLDAYVRWGGRISSVPVNNGNGTYTLTVNYDHHFYVGQSVTAEGTTEDQQHTYVVTAIDGTDPRKFTIAVPSALYLSNGNRFWSRWEYISTITGNSFSVPIPDHHQTRMESGVLQTRYAEFTLHLATFKKDRVETTDDTLIFYTESVTTAAEYNSGRII